MKTKYYWYINTVYKYENGKMYSYNSWSHAWDDLWAHFDTKEISEEDALLKIFEKGG